jgi:hypothetical protein
MVVDVRKMLDISIGETWLARCLANHMLSRGDSSALFHNFGETAIRSGCEEYSLSCINYRCLCQHAPSVLPPEETPWAR